MSLIDDYGTLKTAIASKLNRTNLTAEMPGFVQRAEAKFNREMRHQSRLYRYNDFSFTAEYTSKPSDMLEIVALELYINGERRRIDPEMPGIQVNARGTTAGTPAGYSILNDQIRLSPPPSGSMTGDLLYYRGVTTITGSDSADNWLLLNHSDVYLYLSCMEGALHMQDMKRLQTYGQAFQAAFESLLVAGMKQRQGGAMRVRLG